jgi:cell division septum initiation protein DivIVA
MEVKEAIELLSNDKTINAEWNSGCDFYDKQIGDKEIDQIIALLKSLESENKKLKKENKALRKDKWELEGINEACRKENEAYREMWEALWDVLELCTIYDSKRKGIQTYAEVILPELEQKYLGGGE